MPYCSKCGAEMEKDAQFCPKCGAPAGAMEKVEHRATGASEKRQEACFGPAGSGGG